MSALLTLLHFTWALPQTLLGLVIRGCGHGEIVTHKNTKLISVPWLCDSAFSLGRHVFCPSAWWESDLMLIRHELGHSKQSLILGWLYLLVVALPSVIWFYLHKWCKFKRSYYWFYTERWANKLAGINLE